MLDKSYRVPEPDIVRAVKQGKYSKANYFSVAVRPNSSVTHPRFCFIVSTKISKKAVDRNRIKRRLRAAVSVVAKDYQFPLADIVFLTKSIELANQNFSELKAEIVGALKLQQK